MIERIHNTSYLKIVIFLKIQNPCKILRNVNLWDKSMFERMSRGYPLGRGCS